MGISYNNPCNDSESGMNEYYSMNHLHVMKLNRVFGKAILQISTVLSTK